MKKRLSICDTVKVKLYNREANSSFTEETKAHRDRVMPGLIGKTVVIVDISDSHGLMYGIVYPNFYGSSKRQSLLEVHWLEPDELEYIRE